MPGPNGTDHLNQLERFASLDPCTLTPAPVSLLRWCRDVIKDDRQEIARLRGLLLQSQERIEDLETAVNSAGRSGCDSV